MTQSPLVIWRFRDGKPGHEQQTLGLAQAVARIADAQVIDVDVNLQRSGLMDWLLARFPVGKNLPPPDLLMGAGHATHWPMLAAKRAFGGRTIVLMKPSLPRFLFDAVIVPEHDGLKEGGNVLVTRGALNTMRPGEKRPGSVLVLLGGDSKHGRWDSEQMLALVRTLQAESGMDFLVSDSRRTPADFSSQLKGLLGQQFQPWQDCPLGWLRQQLSTTEQVWVSEDSASMIFEALSAGCRVGVLPLEKTVAGSRVIAGIKKLAVGGLIRYHGDNLVDGMKGSVIFQEADRVAVLLRERGFLDKTETEAA